MHMKNRMRNDIMNEQKRKEYAAKVEQKQKRLSLFEKAKKQRQKPIAVHHVTKFPYKKPILPELKEESPEEGKDKQQKPTIKGKNRASRSAKRREMSLRRKAYREGWQRLAETKWEMERQRSAKSRKGLSRNASSNRDATGSKARDKSRSASSPNIQSKCAAMLESKLEKMQNRDKLKKQAEKRRQSAKQRTIDDE